MKKLIFISENYSLSKNELELFIYFLKEENLLKKHLPFLQKKIDIEFLIKKLLDNKNVKQEKNIIIYDNRFTKERTKLYLSFNEIYLETNVDETSLKRYFYLFSKNYLLID